MIRTSWKAVLVGGASALILSGAAAAQTRSSAEAEVQEVVVTGSRVARAGFTTPTPTTVVGEVLMQSNATASIAGVLQAMPAFKADYSSANSGPRSFGNPGASFANLRSLGSVRTLTLADGRRIVPSAPTGQADLNIIPAVLIDRVEVVTGGASAAYGSDAVSGVVNVIMKHDIDGFVGDVSMGQTKYDDFKGKHVGLAWGGYLFDRRLHLQAGGEYEKNKGTGTLYERDWGEQEWGVMPNPAVTAQNPASANNPANILVPNYRPSNTTPGGMVPTGPLRGLVFLPNGQTRQFQYGGIVGLSFMSGGEGYGLHYSTAFTVDPIKRQNLIGRVDFEATENIHVFAEAAWAEAHTLARGAQPRDTTPLSISINNPFLPASIRTLMTANNLTTLPVGRSSFEVGNTQNDVKTTVTRYAVGVDGKIGDWSWDAFAQFGRTDYHGDIHNVRITANWNNAINAVTAPNGQIVCASTLTNPNNGCIPANVFGEGSISAASKAYFMGDAWFRLKYRQEVYAANLRGSPFSTWAGPVDIAAGVEHRREEADGTSDPISQAGGWNIGNQRPIAGKFHVTESYLEAVTPLLADQAFAKRLEVDTAIRVTDYSTSGRVETWKVGANWEINDHIRLRATRSRDIRAANISELYAQGISSNVQITNPASRTTGIVPNILTGNPDLLPEKADTLTFGVVWRPSFVPGLDISIDRYHIDLRDAITSLLGQRLVDLCFGGAQDLCQFVTVSNNVITRVSRPQINIASVKTTGYDFEVRYFLPFDRFSETMTGDLTLQLYATHVEKMRVDDGTGVIVNRAGENGDSGTSAYGQPSWRGSFIASYHDGPFRVTGTVRYISGGLFNKLYTAADINDNKVEKVVYVDLASQYELIEEDEKGRSLQLYGVIQNLFDLAPPVTPTNVSVTNHAIYDVLGRTYKVGLKFTF